MNRSMKVFAMGLCVLFLSPLILAGTFSLQGGQGVSTVGSGGDYASLADAASDFNGFAGGCTGDWTLLVISDLTVPANVAFGNSTNGHRVTIRPAPGAEPVIRLTAPTVGTIPGHLVIGAVSLTTYDDLKKTDNFTINGCSDDGWSTRSLTFINSNSAIPNSRVLMVVGNSDDFTMKNCKVTNQATNTGILTGTAVELHIRSTGEDYFIPDNATFENCELTAATARYGTGIRQTRSGDALTVGNAMRGLTIRRNLIHARIYGVHLAQTAGAEIHDNTIRVTQTDAGYHIRGIYYTGFNSGAIWSLNIYNNTIDKLQSVNTGATGIDLGSLAVAAGLTPVSYNVYNNMICGFNFTNTTPAENVIYRGIYCDGYSSLGSDRDVFLNIHHNSVYLPHFDNLTYTDSTAGRQAAFGIGCPVRSGNARTIDLRNNNVRVEQKFAACIHPGISTYAARTLNYNNLSADTANGALTARYNTAYDFATLADWQAALANRYDQNSVSVNPLAPRPPLTGVWAAADNLLYTSYPSTRLHARPIAGITTDIKGAARSAIHPFMGCEEHQASGPRIRLFSENLNFGRALILSEGGVAGSKTLVIQNVGTEDLIISGVTFISGSNEFVFDSVDTLIAPGATGNCRILYTPETLGPVSATFQVASNDAFEPDINFNAVGEGGFTKRFSRFPVGRGSSLVGNGPDDDYATLAAAAADFNSVAGGCTGDWNIFITSDLTEPDNIAFGNATNGFKVTIRPAPGVSSTISLTQNNVIVPGHFIVGASNSEDLESLVKTDNFIIDGCSDDAGSTRSLTFLNRNDLEISNSRVILVYGDSDNFTIRNCNIINRSQSITDNGCTGVEFLSRNDGVNNYVPDNGTVENCSITALGSAITNGKFGTGIKQHSLGTVSSGLAQTGLTVKDCDITARYTGIYLGQTAGATLADNTIQLEQISPGIHLRGIWLNTANGSSGWSLDIFNNTMDQLINFDTGITAIDLGAANYMSPHDPITFNVYNNMICGFDFLATMTRYNVPYRGISFDYGSGYNFTIAFKCYFNSIYMPHFPRLAYTPGTVAGMKSAYAIGTPANYLARVLDIRNNSVRVEQYYSAAILYMRYMTNTIVTCDYNNLSADTESGAITGRFADFSTVTEYPALSDWQGAPDGTDSNSVALNPFDTHPPYSGTWTAPDNLLFTSYPSLKMLGTAVEGITTDIQGASRFSILPFMGCHEPKSDGPRIHIEPDSLDYGRCLVLNEGGAVNTGIITISNEGIQNLDIIGITMISGAVDFSIEAVDTPIAPGSTGLCAVRFTPETPGARSAVFRISSNDTGEPVKDFTVQGTGVLTKKLGEYPSGRGPSLVGNVPGADYLTLAEAAADFNAFTGAFTGDWTLRIASDLTEPANVAFGNIVTPPHRVIIRPVEGLSPSVTFTQTGVGAIPGHLIIGATNPNDPAAHVKTDRFTINGFSTDASSERSLTFMNRDDMAIDDSRLILVFGDSDNASIMNCNLLNRSQGNAENDCTAVEFMSWNDGIANFIPDGGTVGNCSITAQGATDVTGRHGIAVGQSAMGTVSQGVAQSGLTVRDCDILARRTGILLGQTASSDIHDNTIRLSQFAPGIHIRGIWLNSANASSGWTMNIFNNTIDQMTNVDAGITAIDLGDYTYMAAHMPVRLNVFNNMICGFNFTAQSPVSDVLYRGIYYDGGSEFETAVNFNCFYNSLYLPHFPNLAYSPGNAISRRAVFAIGAPAGESERIMDVRNNIIRVEQSHAAAIVYMNYLGNTLYSGDYNDLSVDIAAGAVTGRHSVFDSVNEYPSLEDWRSSPDAPDLNSIAVDPFVPSSPYTGTWTSPDNLLFTSYHSTSLVGTPITGITTDIKGYARHPIQPYMGCDEHVLDGIPWAAITAGPEGIVLENAEVSFKLYSIPGASCAIMVEYTTDDGAVWIPATGIVGATSGLASSPEGTLHTIVWNPVSDLGPINETCRLRITTRKDSTPGEWGAPAAETATFTVMNNTFSAVREYSSPATEGWARSLESLSDGVFVSAVDGSFYIATHTSGSGSVSIGAGNHAFDPRNYYGGWQNPVTDIPHVPGSVYLAKFKVASSRSDDMSVPGTRLYVEFVNSAGSLAVAGGNRVGRGPFAPNPAGRTYNVYVQGAPVMNPEIGFLRLKFEVIDFDPAEWGSNTLLDVEVYRFDPDSLGTAVKIATFEPPFPGWTGTALGSPFGNATLGSDTNSLWIETPGPTAGPGRATDFAFWQIPPEQSGVVYEARKLYRSVWTLSVPDAAAEGTCARIRLIMGNLGNGWGAELVADPGSGYREQMPKAGGTEYTLWQETLPLMYAGEDADLNKMGFLYDVADGREDQYGRISLEKVDLYYYDIP